MTRYLKIACLAGNLAAQATLPPTTLDVHVYDWADTEPSILKEAGKTVESIFRNAGIEVRWIVEPPDAPEARIVKIVDPPRTGSVRAVECAARRDMALSILPDAAPGLRPGILGYANPLAPAGINATVFHSRIAATAAESGIPLGRFLGYVIAHEFGHVLLRTAAHNKGGLMSGGWDRNELLRIRNAAMFFERRDWRRMRSAIEGEGCPESRSAN